MKSHRNSKDPRRIALDPVTREFLEGEFQRRFFEAAVQVDPDNLECLIGLGDVYTRQGRYEEGLRIDTRLVELCPDEPTFFYNLACSYSLLSHCDKAMGALRRAIDLGYNDFDYMERDEDLEQLRLTPEFRELFAKLSRSP